MPSQDLRSTAPPALLELLLAALAIVVGSVALAACPDTPGSSDDTFETGQDADDTTGGGDVDARSDADGTTSPPDTADTTPIECQVPGDCGPAGPCADWLCVAERCTAVPKDEGSACDDGDLCTKDAFCRGGVCLGAPKCDDGNPCTTDGCDDVGTCVTTFNQRPCDDQSSCTIGDRCFQGSCQGEAVECDDHEDCTIDSCDPGLGCQHVPREGSCSDGDTCTVNDTCSEGRCVPGAPRACGDPTNPCQRASCDPATGCAIEILSGECDDQNLCTESDLCIDGICKGQLIDCDDDNVCTDDYCDPTLGCTTTDNVLPCEDGDSCTLGDVCADGQCQAGSANPLCCVDAAACDDLDPCTTDTCDGGLCANRPMDCGDGVACTVDVCVAGVCEHRPYGAITEAETVFEDFEAAGALDGWSVASTNERVAWRLDATSPHGGATSLYCGAVPEHTYDFGATLARATRLLDVPPGSAVTLGMWVAARFEDNTSCTYDVVRVIIDDTTLPNPICGGDAAYAHREYDLSAWAGRRVRLTFEFDTIDGQANNGPGIWIDDLALAVTGAPGCCDDSTTCGGGVGCKQQVCDSTSWACGPATDPCDDDDPCTADACGSDGVCTNTAIPGCE